MGIFPYIGLKNIGFMYGKYLQLIGSCCMAIDVFSDIFTASSAESPMRLQSEMKSLKDAEVSCGQRGPSSFC